MSDVTAASEASSGGAEHVARASGSGRSATGGGASEERAPARPRFDPPGPGPWELDAAHFDRPFPRWGRDLFARGFTEGQARWFERVGVPMKGFRVGFVHGFFYAQIVPLIGEPEANAKLPPRWLFRTLSFLHPTLRRRAATARRWLEARGWRDDVRRWDEEVKPAIFARLAALEAEDPRALGDDALRSHLERAGAALVDAFAAHFDTNPTTIYPVAAFVIAARGWTGASAAEVLAAVRGTGASAPGDAALAALAAAVRASSDAGALLAGDDARDVLETLRRREDAIGEAARAWLSHVEPRLISSGDLGLPIGAECPELLLEHVRCAVGPTASAGRSARAEERAASGETVAALRARVPASERARFDDLLAEARLVYRIRDERSTMLDCWTLGLARRALIEVGRRLRERGRLADATHVVDLEHDELVSLLAREEGPSAEEVAERVRARCALRVDDAPELLGTDAREPPPPFDYFDAWTAELLRALFTYMEHMDLDAPAPEKPREDRLEGLPASGGRYRGPARIAVAPDQFASVRPGDVLIARATMPAYNVLLPIVGAIVTDKGGALCHAAIVAREYGLPCVVGTRDATIRLRDGMIVEVDGDAGTVEIVS